MATFGCERVFASAHNTVSRICCRILGIFFLPMGLSFSQSFAPALLRNIDRSLSCSRWGGHFSEPSLMQGMFQFWEELWGPVSWWKGTNFGLERPKFTNMGAPVSKHAGISIFWLIRTLSVLITHSEFDIRRGNGSRGQMSFQRVIRAIFVGYFPFITTPLASRSLGWNL